MLAEVSENPIQINQQYEELEKLKQQAESNSSTTSVSIVNQDLHLHDIPKNTWQINCAQSDPSTSIHTRSIPPVAEIITLLPLAYRLGNHIAEERKELREPIFDLSGLNLQPPHPGPYSGVPCGGVGSGAIGKGYRGDFRRWSLRPARYIHRIVPADLFSIRVKNLNTGVIQSQILSIIPFEKNSLLSSWQQQSSSKHPLRTNNNGLLDPAYVTYHALFPRSWTVYKQPVHGVNVTLMQVSPFLPHNYSESSLPVVVFHVDVENTGTDELEVSVMFSFQNGDGGVQDSRGGNTHIPFHSVGSFNKNSNSNSSNINSANNNNSSGDSSNGNSNNTVATKRNIVGVGLSHNYETVVLEKNDATIRPVPLKADSGNNTAGGNTTGGTGLTKNNSRKMTSAIYTPMQLDDRSVNGNNNSSDNRLPTGTVSSKGNDLVYSNNGNNNNINNNDTENDNNNCNTSSIEIQDESHVSYSTTDHHHNTSAWSCFSSVLSNTPKMIKKTYVDQESFAIATMTEDISEVSDKNNNNNVGNNSTNKNVGMMSFCPHFVSEMVSTDTIFETTILGIDQEKIKLYAKSATHLWKSFHETGMIYNDETVPHISVKGFKTASAVCLKKLIPPKNIIKVNNSTSNNKSINNNNKENFPFSLAWDCPNARFGSGKSLPRYYTRFFGRDGFSAPKIATYALVREKQWLQEIDTWQQAILAAGNGENNIHSNKIKAANVNVNNNSNTKLTQTPGYYKHQLFNELYFIVDGGSIWTDSTNGIANPVTDEATKALTVANASLNRLSRNMKAERLSHSQHGDSLTHSSLHRTPSTTKPTTTTATTTAATAKSNTVGLKNDEDDVASDSGDSSNNLSLLMSSRDGHLVTTKSTVTKTKPKYMLTADKAAVTTTDVDDVHIQLPATLNTTTATATDNNIHNSSSATKATVVPVIVEGGHNNNNNNNAIHNRTAPSNSFSLMTERLFHPLASISCPIALSELYDIYQYMNIHNTTANHCAGQQKTIGQFLYLESHEYYMYNTYDVHFYAGFALLMNFPQLELSLQRDFAASVLYEDLSTRNLMYDGKPYPRKIIGCVPHDLGAPSQFPFTHPNAYNFQDVSNWKDLGPKFVLQIYRDFLFIRNKGKEEDGKSSSKNGNKNVSVLQSSDGNGGTAGEIKNDYVAYNNISNTKEDNEESKLFLADIYSSVLTVMKLTESFDKDNDGVIENSGFPDQTYDVWIATGIHAYCGGLWLTACQCVIEMAKILHDEATVSHYTTIFEKGSIVYNNALWNGYYLNYDNSNSNHHDSIMADMLAGHWYARACNLPTVLTLDQILSCLHVIYEYNVLKFSGNERAIGNNSSTTNGFNSAVNNNITNNNNNNSNSNVYNANYNANTTNNNSNNTSSSYLGAVNGMKPNGSVDQACLQSQEVWTGTTYALAATMMQEAMYYQQKQHLANLTSATNNDGEDVSSGVSRSNTVTTNNNNTNRNTMTSTTTQPTVPVNRNFRISLPSTATTRVTTTSRADDTSAVDDAIAELKLMSFTTAQGIHDAGWQKFGYQFATPEAWMKNGNYRSLGYMRALAIWAIQYAIEHEYK